MGLIKRYAYKVTSGTTEANSAFKSALQGYWPLQEPSGVRYDMRQSHNLTDNNTVTQEAGPGGAYPQAARFTRANSESLHAASTAALQTGDVDFFIDGWFRLTSKPGADMHIAGKWNAAGADREWLLYHNNTADRFYFAVSADGTAYSEDVEASTLGAPALDTWYHIFAYHSAANNELGIRVNGGTLNTQAYSGGVTAQAANLRIGASDESAHFDGRIAGFFFGKGGVPSAAEQDAIYNNGVPISALGFAHLDPNEAGIEFPLGDYEYAPSQALRVPRAPIAGADYDFRLLGPYPGLKGAAQERIRFVGAGDGAFLDALVDLLAYMQNYGLCRLWTIGDDGSERWCWASLASMPEYTLSIPATLLPATLTFDRWSNWFAKYKTLTHGDTGNTGDTFLTVTTGGNALINDAVITIRADSWTNPFWNNSPTWLSNLYVGQFSTARDISSNLHRIRADGGRHKVEWSTDNGQTYANDYAQFARNSGQVRLTVMSPGGANFFLFQGTRTNSRVLIEHFDQWHS